ncbi:MAG: glutamate--cysteine ligase [Actinobacteria bacterium HGW-Actinobacteria-2]|nr:MAG: glutamate--cysteine ligase [Actinobacteria bacterium HGW-Actinobacteria-2]
MLIEFAPSAQSSVGIEWELALVDLASGELAPEAEAVLAGCGADEEGPIRKEYLKNMVELVSGVHRTVGGAVYDLSERLRQVRMAMEPLGLGVIGAGSHPFSRAADQERFRGSRYDVVAERTAYWGQQMAICGTHVHIGVDHRDKALPITCGLSRFYPYLLALSCSSPYWEGQDSGYASQRTLMFQQLPTNGLPYPMASWAEFEDYADDLLECGMINVASEIRWDVRPSPKFGTVENRTADSVPTLAELGAVAALTQCFAEHISRTYEQDQTVERLPPWLVRENKWRAARYGLDAEVIVPKTDGGRREVPLREGLGRWLDRLAPIARELGCTGELETAAALAEHGASYERQRRAGNPQAALRQLLSETGADAPTF